MMSDEENKVSGAKLSAMNDWELAENVDKPRRNVTWDVNLEQWEFPSSESCSHTTTKSVPPEDFPVYTISIGHIPKSWEINPPSQFEISNMSVMFYTEEECKASEVWCLFELAKLPEVDNLLIDTENTTNGQAPNVTYNVNQPHVPIGTYVVPTKAIPQATHTVQKRTNTTPINQATYVIQNHDDDTDIESDWDFDDLNKDTTDTEESLRNESQSDRQTLQSSEPPSSVVVSDHCEVRSHHSLSSEPYLQISPVTLPLPESSSPEQTNESSLDQGHTDTSKTSKESEDSLPTTTTSTSLKEVDDIKEKKKKSKKSKVFVSEVFRRIYNRFVPKNWKLKTMMAVAPVSVQEVFEVPILGEGERVKEIKPSPEEHSISKEIVMDELSGEIPKDEDESKHEVAKPKTKKKQASCWNACFPFRRQN